MNNLWISVEKELPELSQYCIAVNAKGYICGGALYREDGFIGYSGEIKNVTHWMPLPPPPNKEST